MHSQKGLEYSGRHKLVDISTILPPLLTDSYNTITINVGKAIRPLFPICSTTTKANGKEWSENVRVIFLVQYTTDSEKTIDFL